MQLMQHMHRKSCAGKRCRSSAGRIEKESEPCEFARNFDDIGLIRIADRQQDAAAVPAAVLEPVPRRTQALIERFGQIFADADDLTGRFHLGSELRFATDLFKGEDRHLDGRIGRNLIIARTVFHCGELFTKADAHRTVTERHSGQLAHKRNRPGCAGIDLDHIEPASSYDILQIDKADRVQADTEFLRIFVDFPAHIIINMHRRANRDRIAGMYACPLDMLHDAGDEDIGAVTDRIDFDLCAADILVDQHRIVDPVFQDILHERNDIVFLKRNVHILTAEHIRGAHQYRQAERLNRRPRFLQRIDRTAARPLDLQRFQQRIKALSVLGKINAVRIGAEQLVARFLNRPRQTDRSLTAESRHDADRLLQRQNRQHIAGRQRLKIKPVRCIEIR